MAGLVFWPGYGVAPMAPYNQCMKISGRYLLVFALIFLFSGPNCNGQDEGKPVQPIDQSSFGAAQLAGRIEAHRLVECSGLETSLDLSTDGLQGVVLTYKHAYLFKRSNHDSWGKVLSGNPILIPLPLPHNDSDLRQREAICFTPDGRSLLVTSEGRGAGIFRLEAR